MDGPGSSRESACNSGSASESNGNGSGNTETAESEEGDDPSSSSLLTVDDQELDEFRRQWKRELDISPCRDLLNRNVERVRREMQVEERARDLYLQGVEAERRGHLSEAIYFYRRAVQLVPDIEFRVAELLPSYKKDNGDEQSSGDESADDDDDGYNQDVSHQGDTHNAINVEDFITRFARLCNRNGKICLPEFDQKASHISILPREVLLYIWKWVASSELDMRSLEQLALVCRGFYLCSRDAELWRLACMRVWGGNCGSPNKYGSWRDMFIKRPRLRYNGAYISKTTYIRPGEPAFQDQTYRPWHIVDYYRYLRFFPEGIVLMMTTPEEPVLSLSKLRHRSAKHQAILSGHYRLHGDTVSAILKRTKISDGPISTLRARRVRQIQSQDLGEQTFHVELEVLTYKNRFNYKLEWRRYSVHTVYRSGHESVSDFDLSHTKFPPFWFSRVKSYTAVSEKPLQ